MAKSWLEVTELPQYKALTDEEKENARNEYFYDVVAPSAKSFDEIDQLKTDFDTEYSTPTQFDEDEAPEYSNIGKVAERFSNIGAKGLYGMAEMAAQQKPSKESFIKGLAQESYEKKDDIFSMPNIPLAVVNYVGSQVSKGIVDLADMFTEGDAREDIIAANKIVRKEADKALGSKPLQYTGNVAQKFGWEVVEGIGVMAPALLAGWASRNPGVTLGFIGSQVAGTTYSDYMEKTGDHDMAMAAAKFHVVAEVLPETIPVMAALKKAGVGEGVKRMLEATFGEGVQEMLTEVLQSSYDKTQLENMSLKDALLNIDWAQVGHAGLLGMGVGAGIATPGAIADIMAAKSQDPGGPLSRAAETAVDSGATDEYDGPDQDPDKGWQTNDLRIDETGLSEGGPAEGEKEIKTLPEPTEDINAQLDEVLDPNTPKDAVFIAKGTEIPESIPEGLEVVDGESGTLVTSNKAKALDFDLNESDETVAAILGYEQSKTQIDEAVKEGETTAALVVRNQTGKPIHQELVSESALEAAQERLDEQYPGRVEVHDPNSFLQERNNRVEQEVAEREFLDDANVIYRTDGKPFKDIDTAKRAIKNRNLNAVPVTVEGGYGIVEMTDEQEVVTKKPSPAKKKAVKAKPVEQAKPEVEEVVVPESLDDIATKAIEKYKSKDKALSYLRGRYGKNIDPVLINRINDAFPDIETGEKTDESTVTKIDAASEEGRERLQAVDTEKGSGSSSEDIEAKRESEEGALDPEAKPGKIPTAEELHDAANEAATSPLNDKKSPTEAQIAANDDEGNYAKGHTVYDGLRISIENPAGSKRNPEWPPLVHHYGDIKGTEAADGDALDVFINKDNDYTDTPVFIINQTDESGKKFDEHKVMLGFHTEAEARKGYLDNYTKDWKAPAVIPQLTMEEFKEWLKNGDTKSEYVSAEEKTAQAKADLKMKQSEKATASTKAKLAPNPAKDDLITYIRKLGGIDVDTESDVRGRLKQLNSDNRAIGLPGIEQSGGKGNTLDSIGERLIEAGYLEPDPNIGNGVNKDAIIDMLFQAESGEPIFSKQNTEWLEQQAKDEEQRAEEEYQSILAQEAQDMADFVSDNAEYSQVDPETARLMTIASSIDEDATIDIASKDTSEEDVQQALQQFIDEATNAKREKELEVSPGPAPATETVSADQEKPRAESEKPSVDVSPPLELTDEVSPAQAVADATREKDEKRSALDKPEPQQAPTGDDLFAAGGKLEPDLFAKESKPDKPKAKQSEPVKSRKKGIPLTDIKIQRMMNVDGKEQKTVLNANAAFKLSEERLENLTKLRDCVGG